MKRGSMTMAAGRWGASARRLGLRQVVACAVLALLWIAVSASDALSQDAEPFSIRIVYPGDRSSLPALDRIFVYGSVMPPSARVTVNGFDTPLIQTASGAWLAVVPLAPGKFKIAARAIRDDGAETTDIHTVTVAKSALDEGPRPDLGTLAVRKPPAEKEFRPVRVARIVDDTVYLRSGPNEADEQAGYELRLQKNVLVTISGQVAKMYHVWLSDLESVWIDATAVSLLPAKTPRPECFVNAWTIRRLARSTVLSTGMQELLPFRVTTSSDGRTLTLKVYGGISNTDWIHYATDDPWVRHAHWSQPMRGVYQLDIALRRPIWGYDVRYEYRRLVLELRDPPETPAAEEQPTNHRGRERALSAPPLERMRIAIDPGHPPLGTTSPHGVAEHVANWQIAQRLRAILLDRGAQVFLTRNDGETLPLPDRITRSLQADADLFISVHTNALAPSENPFERNGFSVYYFQPFSQPLAEAVHRSLRASVPLRDDGLHYGNLHVIRQNYVPSILVECGYLMWPPEADFLMDPDFQSTVAESIASGIETFMEKRRESGR